MTHPQQTVDLAGCVLLTPDGQKAVAEMSRNRDALAARVADLEHELMGECEDRCELHGGRATHCRACPYHPLRKGDPAEAIAKYLGPPRL